MITPHATPAVAVFDMELPPGLAFVRSLGRAGIPVVAYGHVRRPAGRWSRYVSDFRPCPDIFDADEFNDWLTASILAGEIELVAPTSDFVSFHVADVAARTGAVPWAAEPDQTLACLFKHRFVEAMTDAGFPVPRTIAPQDLDEARAAAAEVGYPVLLKPRSHIGVGLARGEVARTAHELEARFAPYEVSASQQCALRYDPDVALPLVQQLLDLSAVDVVSITGILDRDGTPLAVDASRKLRQWPPHVGVGTLFEAVPVPEFVDRALAAVRQVAGSGIFELEVLVDRRTGELWAIDLNPRAFGQISLDVARGNDLPLLWYSSVTGLPVGRRPVRRRRPIYWSQGAPLAADLAVQLVGGPHRLRRAATAAQLLTRPRVGCMFALDDPVPGMVFGLKMLRHPRGLVRSFWGSEPVDDGSARE